MEQTLIMNTQNTIVAISTPPGTGGIAVVRLSGPDAIIVAGRAWKGRPLSEVPSHSARLGRLVGQDGDVIDSCVATVFRGPKSFTGEDTVEFSLHGSKWIQQKAVESLVAFGAVPAQPGEFTQRAFLNGRLDLAQAEAVADVIAASSRAAHDLALRQLDGSFSARLEQLRAQLVELASLLELELDFSEEDVEFADRSRLNRLTEETLRFVERLADSYAAGRAFKEGIPVVIAGAPNAGKSTLLNRLLDRDKAIVSDIPGTTRDIIEDTVEINGILFRFLDTAGLRDTEDRIEKIGIDRARRAIDRAAVIIWLLDPTSPLEHQLAELNATRNTLTDVDIITVITKQDLVTVDPNVEIQPEHVADTDGNNLSATSGIANITVTENTPDNDSSLAGDISLNRETAMNYVACWGNNDLPDDKLSGLTPLKISAKKGSGIETLIERLTQAATAEHNPDTELIITNARHHAELRAGAEALRRVSDGLKTGLPSDLIAQDVREAIHHLGLLTGAVTTDNLLSTIFSTFCIGK